MTVAPDALVVGDTVPHDAPVHVGPEIVQVTPRLFGSFATVATIGNVPLMSTEPVIGEMLTDAGVGGVPPLEPIDIVICPTILQLAAAGQLNVIWLFPFARPVPESVVECGEPAALSEMLTMPERAPAAPGVNVRMIVQLPFGATFTVFLQVPEEDSAKSETLTPLRIGSVVKVSVEVPLLVTVIVCGGLVIATTPLPKLRLDGIVTTACAWADVATNKSPMSSSSRFIYIPVPVRAATCGDPEALLKIFTFAVRVPVADGVNVMMRLQFEPTPTFVLAAQVLDPEIVKSAAFVPVRETAEMNMLESPVFVNVMVCVALVVLTA